MCHTLLKFVWVSLFLMVSAFGVDVSAEPSGNMIPNEETAVAIAVAVFKPIYGEGKVESQRPFHAELNGGVWHVYGTLQQGNSLGGTAETELSREDGRIIRVWHGK